MSLDDYRLAAIEEERDSALRHVVQLLKGANPNEVAWWLCANHAKFILDYPNLTTPDEMSAIAIRAGVPPTGGTWSGWFNRLRERAKRASKVSNGT